MNRAILLYGLLAISLFASAAANAAEWSTKVDEDVFSGKNTAIMMGGVLGSLSVYLSCDADRNTKAALIFKSGKDGIAEGIKGEIVFKVDDQETLRFDAESYQHNDNYGGFAADLEGEQAQALLTEIKTAKKRILTGLQVPSVDLKQSETLGASGSTTAATSFIKTCEIEGV
jgi:hypothetical protein